MLAAAAPAAVVGRPRLPAVTTSCWLARQILDSNVPNKNEIHYCPANNAWVYQASNLSVVEKEGCAPKESTRML